MTTAELEATMDTTDNARQTRRENAELNELMPESLCGSWALHVDSQDAVTTALVVAEPHAGIYLLQEYGPDDKPTRQRLYGIDKLALQADETWTFYDSRADVLAELGRLLNGATL